MTASEVPGTAQEAPDAAPNALATALEKLPAMLGSLPAAEYHAGPGLSRSLLWEFKRSPLHYRHRLGTPFRQTPAMRLGTLTHTAVLEPERFRRDYVVEPDFGDCRFKANKEARDKWRVDVVGKEIISHDDMEKIRGMSAAIQAHPAARALLLGKDCKREASLYWKDAETGLLCRCRPDVLRLDGIMPDLKTCDSATVKDARRAMSNFGYWLEAAHYVAGLHAVSGLEPQPFPFVFVESDAPHGVAVYVLDERSLVWAEEQRRKLLRAFAECAAANNWPGYPETIQAISLPPWDLNAANDNTGDL